MLSKKFRAFAEVVGVITISLFAVYGMLALLGFAPALAASGGYAPTTPQVAAPTTLGYVGYLKDDAGNPLNATYTMTFRIYATAGITTPLWEETQTDVSIVGGVYNVVLGAVTPLPTNLFDDPQRYLGITVGDYPELLPRQQFASVPYAIYANNATYASQANDFTVSGRLTATTITANGNISWTGHLAGLSLTRDFEISSDNLGDITDLTMNVPITNSMCFLTEVWFQELDTDNEDGKCFIDQVSGSWRLHAYSSPRPVYDGFTLCRARCLQW